MTNDQPEKREPVQKKGGASNARSNQVSLISRKRRYPPGPDCVSIVSHALYRNCSRRDMSAHAPTVCSSI
jgi:hypothetical protein